MATETATLASGCFWCTEAVLRRLKGVVSVTSGYSGGQLADPTYEEVCSGSTGHAEAVQVEFDPAVIPYATLLDVFFATHDPTTLNRQGYDSGTQYRSAIFYHSEAQKREAQAAIARVNATGGYSDPVVTEVTEFSGFYPAEEYHRDFYERNRSYPYCRVIIDPKVSKLYKSFESLTAEANRA
jgi:peptide-methionine (S)-S-oxide reductase